MQNGQPNKMVKQPDRGPAPSAPPKKGGTPAPPATVIK